MPMPCEESQMSTPARQLEDVRADYFPSMDRTVDATPPPLTPPPVVRISGERFKPHRSDGDDQQLHEFSSGVPFQAGAKTPVAGIAPPEQPLGLGSDTAAAAVTQQQQPEPPLPSPADNASREASSTSDPTPSPEVSSSASQEPSLQPTSPQLPFTANRDGGGTGCTGEASMQVDDGGSLVLSLIDDAQCDVVAAMFASVQRSARDRIKTPYPGSSVVRVMQPRAEILAIEYKPPPPVTQQLQFQPRGPEPWSPRSPYHTGIRALPPNAMDLISPPDEEDTFAAMTPPGEHSRSPIDSALQVEVVSEGGAPGDSALHDSPMLPEASAPPPMHMSEPYAEHLEMLRSRGQLEPEAEDDTPRRKDSFDELSLTSVDPTQEEGVRRRAPGAKRDQEDRHD
ncbi:uncharacterized protein LOC119463876 [Dermacentor silvarum]|uniref:uncharacterized protein LOC119463876 n=1 Tax=Dermacentor silvarum TaxID=543639 RepID=UPI002101380A|nr:uncharacterized protein LOC119463876 [Dermacentor silvarum]